MSKEKSLKIKRYPASTNRSLQAWSAADEYLLKQLVDINLSSHKLAVYNDSFGYLSSHLDGATRYVICDSSNQQGAIQKNLSENKLKLNDVSFLNPFEKTPLKPTIGVIKVPKSLELFELYLSHFVTHASVKGKLYAGFMTRHFSKRMIEIANKYFDSVEQSLALKKSRFLSLSKPKKENITTLINTISYNDETISQHYGVFSSAKIDLATQFLIDHIKLNDDTKVVMDLACGNGIIGKSLLSQKPGVSLTMIDDSYVAIESAKLNVTGENVRFIHRGSLGAMNPNTYDAIVCNPPFHLEHEIDISIPLRIFKDAHQCLKTDGHFQLVANQHLNYKTHLVKLFSTVNIVNENADYIIYDCIK